MTMHHKCRGEKADGTACAALPYLLDDDGLCPAHRPGGREAMAERGRKGGLATKRKAASPGLDPAELPELKSHADAQTWLEKIGRAVASGGLGDRQAQAAIRAVAEWVRAEGERQTSEVLIELREEIERVRSEVASSGMKAVG